MKLIKFIPDTSDLKELQKFAEAQFNTIQDIAKELEVAQNKNKHLELMLKSYVSGNGVEQIIQTDEEIICKMEINRLREKILESVLSYEESKKLQIYVELLLKIQNKPKTIEIKTKNMKDKELLALLGDDVTNE